MKQVCNLCNGKEFKVSFPYATKFNKKKFTYFKCLNCKCTSIWPKLNADDQEKLYSVDIYHNTHYINENTNLDKYEKSLNIIQKFLNMNSSIVDFGCGLGFFLKRLEKKFKATGVEFNEGIILQADKNLTNTKLMTIKKFFDEDKEKYDFLFLGDVIEHVNLPKSLINSLKKKLKKNGLIYINGPIENNFTLVNYSIRLYAIIKNLFNLKNKYFLPYHTHYFNYKNKQEIFDNEFLIQYIETEDDGWPYNKGNLIKKIISNISISFGKLLPKKLYYGNRIHIIFKKISN